MGLTLYKTASPETSAEYPEFYELSLKANRRWGKKEDYIVIRHGWWDEQDQKPKEELQIINTVGNDLFLNNDDAFQQFTHYKQSYAKNGFIHSFTKDMLTGKDVYELIEP